MSRVLKFSIQQSVIFKKNHVHVRVRVRDLNNFHVRHLSEDENELTMIPLNYIDQD